MTATLLAAIRRLGDACTAPRPDLHEIGVAWKIVEQQAIKEDIPAPRNLVEKTV